MCVNAHEVWPLHFAVLFSWLWVCCPQTSHCWVCAPVNQCMVKTFPQGPQNRLPLPVPSYRPQNPSKNQSHTLIKILICRNVLVEPMPFFVLNAQECLWVDWINCAYFVPIL